MALRIEQARGESIILDEDFKILDDLAPVRFVVTNQALYLPVLRLIPAGRLFRMRRVPLHQIREASVRKQGLSARLVLAIAEVLLFSSLIVSNLVEALGPMLLIWLVGLFLSLRAVRNAVGATGLVVLLTSGKVVSALPSKVNKKDRGRIHSAYQHVMNSLRTLGVAVSGLAPDQNTEPQHGLPVA